ncbi:trypsin-like peptidase domain-containing protein [Candidatus Saccharibacteria bacterium]|nr:trypsin-like peptidase domain-containing protein [Candidatus Saccharibacteria bacterium]
MSDEPSSVATTAEAEAPEVTVSTARHKKWQRKRPNPAQVALPTVLVIGLVGGVAGSYGFVHFFPGSIPVSKQQLVVQESSAVVDVASKVSPSVVSITTKSVQAGAFGFGQQTAQGAGTGMILTSDGLILTNNHVIDGSTSVTVFTSDGKQYTGAVEASSPSSDYAFVRIKATGLKPVTLGDSSSVQIGQSVIAIGNALGQYQNTVTSGIISGKGRPVTASDSNGSSSESLVDLLQTDAAINEGNSGGPLVNLAGQVIGMNTAISADGQNVGFAIPINEVKSAIESVKSKGVIQRPYLGVRYIPVTSDFATANNLSVQNGAYVSGDASSPAVVPGSPAEAAGLKNGDVITKVDGKTIDENHSLTSILADDKIGQTVKLTVLRDGKTITLSATLASAPSGS